VGFFLSDLKIKKSKSEDRIASEYGCKICPLSKIYHKSPKMSPLGSETPLLYFLGESPGKNEDSQGKQFVGDAGDRLRQDLYKVIDKDFDEECIRWSNLIRCRPYEGNKNRTPIKFEIDCCKSLTIKDIERTKPLVVVGFGGVPLKTFLNGDRLRLWSNRLVPVKIGNHKCWYFVSYHPSFLIRNTKPYKTEYDKTFLKGLETVVDFVLNRYEEPEIIDSEDKEGITIVKGQSKEDLKTIENHLQRFKDSDKITIDVETTALRPFNKEGKLISIAIGNYEDVIAFPIDHPKTWNFDRENSLKSVKEILYNFLSNKNCTKIAHNLKFELEWLYNYFDNDKKFMFENSFGDTMAQAYLLDERTSKEEGMLSLDTLTWLNFGFNLKEKSTVDTKNILKSPLEELLTYNAMDTKFTYKLFEKQEKRLDNTLKICYNDIIKTARTLTLTQAQGIYTDDKVIDAFTQEYSGKLENLNTLISNLDEIKTYKKAKGEFNPLSQLQVVIVLRDILKIPKVKGTSKNEEEGYSTSDKILESLRDEGIKLAGYILEYRSVNKLLSTYILNAKELAIEGILYPNFNLFFTGTGRLSSGRE
jgi:uracil-DNA glycosylase family 4